MKRKRIEKLKPWEKGGKRKKQIYVMNWRGKQQTNKQTKNKQNFLPWIKRKKEKSGI